jgi:hypothetical protein
LKEVAEVQIKDYLKGNGPEILPGYCRGDSWVQIVGPHVDCGGKVWVIGAGYGRDRKGRWGDGVLVRCSGCLFSWVLR